MIHLSSSSWRISRDSHLVVSLNQKKLRGTVSAWVSIFDSEVLNETNPEWENDAKSRTFHESRSADESRIYGETSKHGKLKNMHIFMLKKKSEYLKLQFHFNRYIVRYVTKYLIARVIRFVTELKYIFVCQLLKP